MSRLRLMLPGSFTVFRHYNWKYPRPVELQAKPPAEEKIDPNNIVRPDEPIGENDCFNKEFLNRNPRNLEQMLLEIKPHGFILDSPSVQFWNKVHFTKSLKNTSAKIVHHSGRTIITASTQEWAIRRQLYSAIDLNAVKAIAQVLAARCLQSGILSVHHYFSPEEYKTHRIQLFLSTLEENGLQAKELNAIRFKDQDYL